MTFAQYFKGLFGGIAALIKGMMVTLKELFSKKVTQQYPENRKTLVMSDRFRGELVMPHDQNNEHACTACGICQMNCPNGTITVVSKTIETEEGKKKKILDRYFYDLGMCTFCNLCVITCPSDAIKFENTFENAVFTHSKLTMQLNHEGSKLREKKKPAPAPTADKPAAEKPATAISEKPEPAKTETAKEEKIAVEKKTENVDTKPSEENASAPKTKVEPKKEEKIEPILAKPAAAEEVKENVIKAEKKELTHPPKSQIDDNPAVKLPESEKPAEPKNVVIKDNSESKSAGDNGKNKYRI